MQKLVTFSVCGQELGVPILAVKETLPPRPLTRLFLVPEFVAGLINLRGEVVAVLDLARLLGLDAARAPVDEASLVVLRAGGRAGARAGGKAAAGLLVDRLLGVRDVAPEAMQPLPPAISAEAAAYLSGLATVGEPRRPLLVIAPESVLESERLRPYRRT
jgi:purine-binding chemotaxis protein CheW